MIPIASQHNTIYLGGSQTLALSGNADSQTSPQKVWSEVCDADQWSEFLTFPG